MNDKVIAVVGLGLIGGSFARAIKKYTSLRVLGADRTPEIVVKAIADGAVDGELTDPSESDVVLICLWPDAAVDYVVGNASKFRPGAVVIDACGIKSHVCPPCFEAAKKNGFTFIGGHPMAGIEKQGYDNSFAELFEGASMILVPDEGCGIPGTVKSLFLSIGFARVTVSTPQEHDRIIAYTSQLAHVVSSAYVRDELSSKISGFSAGSFKDLTRVAFLNENMWSELFVENAGPLSQVIDSLIARLNEYRDLIASGDREKLTEILREGRIMKTASDECLKGS